MEKIIKKVLSTIENNGFEAYIVGGYVRDFLLNKKSCDIDICTNALPKDLLSLFPNGNIGNYGTISFKIKNYDFEITTYRKEDDYENRHPKNITYVNNLLTDLNRRDFLLNSICMNNKGQIIDMLNGIDDINSKTINVIGNCNDKFREDPLRMLRAIRLSTLLDFALSKELEESLIENSYLIGTLSKNRIKSEFDKILASENAIKGIELLEKFDILNIIGLSFEKLCKVEDLCGMWALFDFKQEYPFTKEEKNNIIKIKEIVKKGSIDSFDLFYNGLYICTVAGEILGISKKYINDLYKNLKIYDINDICLSANDIMNYLNIDGGKIIGNVINDLCFQIINNNIKNNKKQLYLYLDKYKENVK